MPKTDVLLVTPFLHRTLLLDGLVSGAAGVMMLAGAPLVAALTALPIELLAWAGALLLPWCALLLVLSRRATMPRLWLIDVIAVNALWVAASFGALVSGAVQPNIFGYAFVIAQALAVIVFAELQVIALRRNGTVTA